jgi:uncharacterized delta-60 repeat protein
MKRIVCLFLGLSIGISFAQTKFAVARYLKSNGTLDSSFGTGGRVATGFKHPVTQAELPAGVEDLAILDFPTRTIAVGNAGNFAALAAYTDSGGLDPNFNGGAGTRILHLESSGYAGANATSRANAVAVQNSKIVVAGWFMGDVCGLPPEGCVNRPQRFAVARFNPDGSLDQGFGVGGIVHTTFVDEGCSQSWADAVAIDATDRIIVGGSATCFAGDYFAVARFHSNGTLDFAFSQNGKATVNLESDASSLSSLRQRIRDLRTDVTGRIVGTGTLYETVYSGVLFEYGMFVAFRLLSTGQLDPGFNQSGVLRVREGFVQAHSNEGHALAIQPDGRIVAAGETWFTPPGSAAVRGFTVARVQSNGQLDTLFSGDGIQDTLFQNAPPYSHSGARDLALMGDKILAVGWSGGYFALAQYSSTGTLDPAFGNNGRVLTNFTCEGSEAASAVAVPNSRSTWFVVGGKADGNPCSRN